MKRLWKRLVYMVALTLIATLAACSSGVPQEDYDAGLAEWVATQLQLDESEILVFSLLSENESLQDQVASLQKEMNFQQARLSLLQAKADQMDAWFTLGLSSGHSELSFFCLSQEEIAELEKEWFAFAME